MLFWSISKLFLLRLFLLFVQANYSQILGPMRSDRKFLLASNGWGSLWNLILAELLPALDTSPFCEHVLRGPARQAEYQIAKSLLLLIIALQRLPRGTGLPSRSGISHLPRGIALPGQRAGSHLHHSKCRQEFSGKQSLETPVWEQAGGREYLFLPEDGKWLSESLSSSLTAACQNKPACLALLNDV